MSVPVALPRPRVGAPRRAARPARHLADLTREQRREAVTALGEPAFRADQLSRHYFAQLTDPARLEAFTDLPAARRAALVADLLPALLTPVRHTACDGGTTRKTLWRAAGGALLESVVMRYPDRTTVCVSSQAGCGMACPFCATGQGGLTRNLSTAEIVEQVLAAARALRDGEIPAAARAPRDGEIPAGQVESASWPDRVTNVVFMGMGEPLANYAATVAALRRLTEPPPAGFGMARRGVTVSTVGLVPAIDRLAGEGLPVTLALSLHAPDDELRDELVPINTRWSVADVLAAAWRYADTTGRRVSIEYALISDVNDQPERADHLAGLLAGHLVHVNLIPLNPTPGSPWTASTPAREREFVRRLRAAGVAVTVRDTRGREIAGACGQLAATEDERP
jgi:23S rRNA (adenine2503-C2)-methyltransferase